MQTLNSGIVFLGAKPAHDLTLDIQTYGYPELSLLEKVANRADVVFCSLDDPGYSKALPDLLKWKKLHPALQFVCETGPTTKSDIL